jgi:hypothetical protein
VQWSDDRLTIELMTSTLGPQPQPPAQPATTVVILAVASSTSGALDGTARRPDTDTELPFHGVVDLVGVIERLVSAS